MGLTFPPPSHHTTLMISERFFSHSGLWSVGFFFFVGEGVGHWLFVEGICIYVHLMLAWSGVTSTWVLQKALVPTTEVVLQGCLQVWFFLSCFPAWGLALCLTWLRIRIVIDRQVFFSLWWACMRVGREGGGELCVLCTNRSVILPA